MMFKQILSLSLLTALAACGGGDNGPNPTAPDSPLTLASDPGKAMSVVEAKAAGKKEGVVVEGRVWELTDGWAMMKIMDASLDYCGEINKEDKCPTPWDYCCDTPDDRAAHSLLVKAIDEKGEALEVASMPGMRLVDKVKIRGDLTKDEHGNPVLIAKGIYRIERPTLPDYIKWPQ